jgi:hypothetical protein
MVDVKQAVARAMDYLKDMYRIEQFKDVLLEEVDLSEDNKYWNVTIGFTRRQETTSGGPMATLIGQSFRVQAGVQGVSDRCAERRSAFHEEQ